jgi:serine/threonine protein phosphatase 1
MVDPYATTPSPGAGTAPRVPVGTILYAIGDIHGRTDLLERLLDGIAADVQRQALPRSLVVYLGDYVDRGPDSAGVIDLLLDEAPPGLEPVHLLGNHERMMLDFLGNISVGAMWLRNGGDATLRSYGIDCAADEADPQRLQELQAALRQSLPVRHLEFLRALPLTHVEGDYFFVHAGVRPGVALADQREEDMIWIRGPFLSSTLDHGKIVVHGHTIAPEPQVRTNRIGIDTGAWYTDRLTALALDGERRRLLATGG